MLLPCHHAEGGQGPSHYLQALSTNLQSDKRIRGWYEGVGTWSACFRANYFCVQISDREGR